MRSGRNACASSSARDAVAGDLDVVALEPQRALQDLGDLLVVLDDEHANGAGGGLHRHDGTAVADFRRDASAAFSVRRGRARAGVARARRRGRGRCLPAALPARKPPAPRAPLRGQRARARARAAPLDLIGLGAGRPRVFFAFLVYLGWDGGRAGSGGVDGPALAVGAVHYLVPVALMAAGAILVLRPVLPAVRPFRARRVCLFAALTLALAAGTLGLGPGGERPLLGPDVRQAPRRDGRRGAVLGDVHAARRRRRAHRRAVPAAGGCAAADRRLGRRRGQGDERLGLQTTRGCATASHAARAAARRRASSRSSSPRASRCGADRDPRRAAEFERPAE